MMIKKMDDKLKEKIERDTIEATKLKDTVWKSIEAEISKQKVMPFGKRRKKKWLSIITVAAVMILVLGTFYTDTGKAFIKSVQEMFEKEKNIELNIEGMKEDIEVELGLNEELDYVIYIDKSHYKLVENPSGNQIVPIEEFEDIPNVMMEITKKENTTKEAELKKIKEMLASEEMEITLEEIVDMPFDGILVSAIGIGASNTNGQTGMDWDSPVFKYYVMNDKDGALFVIEQQYFLEASEGHGARFDSMLETFEIISESNN